VRHHHVEHYKVEIGLGEAVERFAPSDARTTS